MKVAQDIDNILGSKSSEYNWKGIWNHFKIKSTFSSTSSKFCMSILIQNQNDQLCDLQLLSGGDNSCASPTTKHSCEN
jgi:hypothetical protein